MFDLASGEFFRWHAHDDLLAPGLIELLVSELDADDSVVLAHSWTRFIDADGAPLEVFCDDLRATSVRPADRLREVVRRLTFCNAVFGLVRSDVLARTARIGEFPGSDVPLLYELAVLGRFAVLPEELFLRRPGNSLKTNRSNRALAAWFGPSARGARLPSFWLWLGSVRAIARSPYPVAERIWISLVFHRHWPIEYLRRRRRAPKAVEVVTSPARWLWITAEITADPGTGGLLYSMELARAVARTGGIVTMIGLGGRERRRTDAVDRAGPGDRRAPRRRPEPVVVPAESGVRHCGSIVRTRARRRAARSVGCRGDRQPANRVGPSISSRALHRGVTVFITQNHDATVRRRVAAEASVLSGKRALLSLDRWKVTRLERRATELADVITSITDDDRRLFEADAPTKRHLVLRPGWSGEVTSPPRPIGERPRRVGIVGSFEWHVKQENLRRFLLAADPILARAGVELVVGGKAPDSFVSEFSGRLAATTFLGWIDDLGAVLRECRIGVISEPLGGGFKMKSLDYVFNEVPIAALVGAAAGLPLVPGVDMLEAANEGDLAEVIVAALDDAPRLESMAAAARSACEQTFSWDAAGAALVSSVMPPVEPDVTR